MAPQDILRQLKQTPFKPFRLHISDGATYDVLDPYMAYLDLTQVVVGTRVDEETGLLRKSIYLAPNHFRRLEPLDEPKPKKGGGRP